MAFDSRSLSSIERNYSSFEREAFAMVLDLKTFLLYVLSVHCIIEVNLQSLTSAISKHLLMVAQITGLCASQIIFHYSVLSWKDEYDSGPFAKTE